MSTDARDHDRTVVCKLGGEWKSLCRCGWEGAWWRLESQAEDEYDHHVDIATMDAETEGREQRP